MIPIIDKFDDKVHEIDTQIGEDHFIQFITFADEIIKKVGKETVIRPATDPFVISLTIDGRQVPFLKTINKICDHMWSQVCHISEEMAAETVKEKCATLSRVADVAKAIEKELLAKAMEEWGIKIDPDSIY
jgi:hypothetical protein